MKILELFSGYGTATFALKRLGIPHEIIGYSDIDKYANQCFQQNHGGKELGDVKLVNPNDLEDFDLLTGGFPCQSFSVAGKGLGELDPRGTLFYEIIRIAEVKKPKYMLLENVKGLTNKTHKATFDKIIEELTRIGYYVHWKVLNSKDFGIPQSRARVWFVCFRNDLRGVFEWPKPVELKIFIKDILEENVDPKYYLSEKIIELIKRHNLKEDDLNGFTQTAIDSNYFKGIGNRGNKSRCFVRVKRIQYDVSGKGYNSQQDRIYNINGVMPSIPCSRTFDKINIYSSEKDFFRKLTPKECFRLQGFLNDEINLDGLSDTQRYKLAGNGQDVNMVSLIFKEMFK